LPPWLTVCACVLRFFLPPFVSYIEAGTSKSLRGAREPSNAIISTESNQMIYGAPNQEYDRINIIYKYIVISIYPQSISSDVVRVGNGQFRNCTESRSIYRAYLLEIRALPCNDRALPYNDRLARTDNWNHRKTKKLNHTIKNTSNNIIFHLFLFS
jgi:hypothetical protein